MEELAKFNAIKLKWLTISDGPLLGIHCDWNSVESKVGDLWANDQLADFIAATNYGKGLANKHPTLFTLFATSFICQLTQIPFTPSSTCRVAFCQLIIKLLTLVYYPKWQHAIQRSSFCSIKDNPVRSKCQVNLKEIFDSSFRCKEVCLQFSNYFWRQGEGKGQRPHRLPLFGLLLCELLYELQF